MRNHLVAQFIGKELRPSKVEIAPRAESGPIFNFYMGKNTPEREDYFIDKLVVPAEERYAQVAAGVEWEPGGAKRRAVQSRGNLGKASLMAYDFKQVG